MEKIRFEIIPNIVQIPEFLGASILHADLKIFFKRNAILSLRKIMLINEVTFEKNQLKES